MHLRARAHELRIFARAQRFSGLLAVILCVCCDIVALSVCSSALSVCKSEDGSAIRTAA